MKGLTEHEIIRIVTNQFSGQPGIPLGFDDDVSAIPISSKSWIIVKTDMLVGSTDVPPGMTVQEAARRAVVATISDFASKGVQPTALMVSLGLPAPAKKTTVQALARGLGQAAREYKCKIIGGDTNQADDLVIDIAGIGIANPKTLVRRNGARPGDIIAVTGSFGKTSAGLGILTSRREKDLAKYPSLVRAVRRPRARLAEGIILAKSSAATSSIDSSDGLAWSLHQIARSSKVGINLHTIPIASDVQRFAKEHRLSALDLALYGGEEYELVVTIRPERFHHSKKRVPSLTRIGIVETQSFGVLAHLAGKRIQVKERGWEHFS
ncbi:thiamine-phosphate kinase [Candidatus Bathyarchaeota archaeon]|nr:MAG: thiamine-phosphate kinase [Candidatus Bathyarchaeota archaeon]